MIYERKIGPMSHLSTRLLFEKVVDRRFRKRILGDVADMGFGRGELALQDVICAILPN